MGKTSSEMDVKLVKYKFLTRETRHVVQAYSLALGLKMRGMPVISNTCWDTQTEVLKLEWVFF